MNIYTKLANVQVELKAPKGNYNSFGKYHYRSAESILEAVKPCLVKQGLVQIISDEVEQRGDRYYIKAQVKLVNIDNPEEVIEVSAYARESLDKKGMDDSQITGTASSYARKYALNGLYAIDDTKDADTDEYAKTTQRKPQRGKQQGDASDYEKINTEEQMKLVTAAQNGGISNEEMKTLLDEMGFKSSKDIEKNQLKNVLEAVENLSFQKVLLKNEMV